MEQITNKIDTESKKRPKPPYLPVVKLEKLIGLVSNRNLSDISSSLFVKYGFRIIDALLAVNALEFLGLIDKKGKPTSQMAQLRLQGEARKKAFETIVRKAYEKLFNVTDKPYALSRDELFNEFAIHYKLSRRIITSAMPTFLKLCEYAGLKEETQTHKISSNGKIKKIKGKKIIQKGQTLEQLDDVAKGAGFTPTRVAEGRMVLNIPSKLKDKILESDNAELHKDWRDLRSNIKDFADKYIPDNLPEKEISVENTEDV